MGIGFGWLINKVIDNIKKAVADIKALNAQNRQFKTRMDAMDKMKADGDFHEWIYVPSTTGELMVCKKTGWCPSLKGFFPMQNIKQHLADKQADEDYKVFRAARVEKLSKRLNLAIWDMEQVVEEVFSIKKDFTLIRLTKLQEELKAVGKNESNKV